MQNRASSSFCLPFPCLQQRHIWTIIREKKKKEKNRPPPAEQALNQNKAEAAAKSWEALLFNA